MAIRDFTDGRGNSWTVWSTLPQRRSGVPVELRDGWLTFECGAIRKRLSPIPANWEDASTARLELYCGAAETLDSARRSNPRNADVTG